MSWLDWSLYVLAISTEIMLYAWGIGAMLYGVFYFGRLLWRKLFSEKK